MSPVALPPTPPLHEDRTDSPESPTLPAAKQPLTVPRGSLVSDHLDCIRGLAAIGVLLNHGRNLFFDDYSQLTSPGPMARLAYLVTGLGHEMVMVFFVLSGFFIGSSVIRDLSSGRWNNRRYIASRMSRLYVVLIPALALTWALDQIGIRTTASSIYYGVGPQSCIPDVTDALGPVTLIGNLAFLEKLYVPPFGTNGPLWSLSYEFWYYVLFPLICLCLFRGIGDSTPRSRFITFALLLAAAAIAWETLPLFPIWLLGAAIATGRRLNLPSETISRSVVPFCAATFITTLLASRLRLLPSPLLSDYAVGLGFAMLLVALLHLASASRNGLYSRFARGLAGMSFSLYLTHIPILVLIAATWNLESRWRPTGDNVLKFTAVLIATLAIAWVFAQLTEKHTDRVRRWLLRDE